MPTQNQPVVSLRIKKDSKTTALCSITVLNTLLQYLVENIEKYPYFVIQIFLTIFEAKRIDDAGRVKNSANRDEDSMQYHQLRAKLQQDTVNHALLVPAVWSDPLQEKAYLAIEPMPIRTQTLLFSQGTVCQYRSSNTQGVDLFLNHPKKSSIHPTSSVSTTIECAHVCMSIFQYLIPTVSKDEQVVISCKRELENFSEYVLNVHAYYNMYLRVNEHLRPPTLILRFNTGEIISSPSAEAIDKQILSLLEQQELCNLFKGYQSSHYKM